MPIINKTMVGEELNLWHGREATQREEFELRVTEYLNQQGCQRVYTPHVCKVNKWTKKPWPPVDVDGQMYQYLPPKWPMHVIIATVEPLSYKDLPVVLFELGELYNQHEDHIRNVPGITLTGLNSDAALCIQRFQEYYDSIGKLMPAEIIVESNVASRWEELDENLYTTTAGTKEKLHLVAMNIKWWPRVTCESESLPLSE